MLYNEEDLKKLSIQELFVLLNKITDERNYYRDKVLKLESSNNVIS